MSSQANTVTAIDSKKPTTKQELVAANIKLLIEQLEAGHSEALTNYLTAMSRFHNYIHLYHGNASLLAESLEVIQKTAAVILAALEPTGGENDTAATEAPELAEVAA
jgi:hypothetical protein